MSRGSVLGTIVLSVLGFAAGTALTLLSLESVDMLNQRNDDRIDVVLSVISSALADNKTLNDHDVIENSKLFAFASPPLLGAYLDYKANCSNVDISRDDECKILWAEAIQSMRDDLETVYVSKKDIIAALWGDPG